MFSIKLLKKKDVAYLGLENFLENRAFVKVIGIVLMTIAGKIAYPERHDFYPVPFISPRT